MKALAYALVALAAISCATVQPDTATSLEDSAVRLAHGDTLLGSDVAPPAESTTRSPGK